MDPGTQLSDVIAVAASRYYAFTENPTLVEFFASNGLPNQKVSFASCRGGSKQIYNRLNQEDVQDATDLAILLLGPKDKLAGVVKYVVDALEGRRTSRAPSGPVAFAKQEPDGTWRIQSIVATKPTAASAFAGEIHSSDIVIAEQPLNSAGDETPVAEIDEIRLSDIVPILLEMKLHYPEELLVAVLAALRSGKHLLLTGPPGCGKTSLAIVLGRVASKRNVAREPILTTGTADWSSVETVGAYRLMGQAGLRFEPGHVLKAMAEERWLVIDELNRADIDKAIGQLFTVLSGHAVTLPFMVESDQGEETSDGQDPDVEEGGHQETEATGAGKDASEAGEDARSGRSAEDIYVSVVPAGADTPEDTAPIFVSERWRLIATMNDRDQDLLFTLSEALLRRFAVVQVTAPDADQWTNILAEKGDTGNEVWNAMLLNTVEVLASMGRTIGAAVILDCAAYLSKVGQIQHERAGSLDVKASFSSAWQLFIHPQLKSALGGGDDLSGMALKRVLESPATPEVLTSVVSSESTPDNV